MVVADNVLVIEFTQVLDFAVDAFVDFLIFRQLYFFDGVNFVINIVFGSEDRSEAALTNFIDLLKVILVSIIGGHGTQCSEGFFGHLILLTFRFLRQFSNLSCDCNLLGM